ncbi:MAG: hypothetical protein ACI9MR_005229 [Myxococcota bacterium]|jgi:hypothetical protein
MTLARQAGILYAKTRLRDSNKETPMEPTILRGQCLCGAVRIALTPPTLFASHCHCESCRRAHAAAFVTWTAVPTAQFVIEENASELSAYASSDGVTRSFCRTCGTSLMYTGQGRGAVYVPVGVLTTPLDRPVDSHVSYEEHVAWLDGVVGLPCFEAKTDVPTPSRML